MDWFDNDVRLGGGLFGFGFLGVRFEGLFENYLFFSILGGFRM